MKAHNIIAGGLISLVFAIVLIFQLGGRGGHHYTTVCFNGFVLSCKRDCQITMEMSLRYCESLSASPEQHFLHCESEISCLPVVPLER